MQQRRSLSVGSCNLNLIDKAGLDRPSGIARAISRSKARGHRRPSCVKHDSLGHRRGLEIQNQRGDPKSLCLELIVPSGCTRHLNPASDILKHLRIPTFIPANLKPATTIQIKIEIFTPKVRSTKIQVQTLQQTTSCIRATLEKEWSAVTAPVCTTQARTIPLCSRLMARTYRSLCTSITVFQSSASALASGPP